MLLLTRCFSPSAPQIIKIGLVAPFEGQHRDIGYDAIYAARLAIREINATGLGHGRYIELVAYDDRGNIELARRVAASLIADSDVVAVIGHYVPDTTQEVAPRYAEAGLPHIVVGGGAVTTEDVWHLWPDSQMLAQAMVDVALRQDANSFDVWGEDRVADAVRTILMERDVRSLLAGDPDVALTTWSAPEIAEQLQAWRAEGWAGELLGDDALAGPALHQLAGADAEGALFVTPYPYPQDLVDSNAWVAAYKAMGPHVSDPGPLALATYEAVYVVADALRGVLSEQDDIQRSTLMMALDKVQRSGWLGDIAWDERRNWEAPPLYLYQWRQGQPQLVEQVF